MTAFYLQESTIDGRWTYKLTSPNLMVLQKGAYMKHHLQDFRTQTMMV